MRRGDESACGTLRCVFGVDQTILAAPGGRVDPEQAPARPAVVLLVEAGGAPVLLATTADARGFLRKRLGGGPAAGGGPGTAGSKDAATAPEDDEVGAAAPRLAGGPRADLSAVVARADLTLVGSGFEADLAFLEIARRVMPGTCDALTEHWRGWFVHLNPEAAGWRKTNLADVASGAMEARIEHLIGPVNSKDLAGKLGERIDDAFDLCRFPRELALAPRGTACAYKEMGRCPAPCDGSEPIEGYRERVKSVLRRLGDAPDSRDAGLSAAMFEASRAQDYRRAAEVKGRIDRLELLEKPAMREARPLHTLRFVGVFPAAKAGVARAWWIDAWHRAHLGDFDSKDLKASARVLADVVTAKSDAQIEALREQTPGGIDAVLVGVLTRHLFKKKGGGGSHLLRIPLGRIGIEPQPNLFLAFQAMIRAAGGGKHGEVEEFDRATVV